MDTTLKALAILSVVMLASGAARAATIIADGNSCTLTDAITAANTNSVTGGCRAGNDKNAGGDIIVLRSDVMVTSANNLDINGCPNGLPAVTSTIRIKGNRHTIARVGPNNKSHQFRLLDSTAGNLTLKDVTVTNGYLEQVNGAECDGAGINGTVTLINSTVSGNQILEGNGGGINGIAILTNSTVSDNSVTYGSGGGIKGASTLLNSTVSGNCAGCLPSNLLGRTLVAPDATIRNSEGGGIAGSMTLIDSVVSGNVSNGTPRSAGGGLTIDGNAIITNTTISGNQTSGDDGFGGGIHLYEGALTLVNSTVSGNIAQGGDFGLAGDGGGIFSSGASPNETGPGGPVTLIHSTVVDNSSSASHNPSTGGGIYGDTVTLINSIVAKNSALTTPTDCVSTDIHYKGLNLVGDGSCASASSGQLTGDPMLGPLASYGGLTPVQPPLAGSPVIDRINFIPLVGCAPTYVTTDQLGIPRPQPPGGNCDLGAVEYTGFPQNPVLDSFNRQDGPLGATWSGSVGLGKYKIAQEQVNVGSGGPVYWVPSSFGVNQEAYVTFVNIDGNADEQDLLLKVQSGGAANHHKGEIEVDYQPRSNTVSVQTLLPGAASWTIYPSQELTFRNGDQMGARVLSTGEVRIYRNHVMVAAVMLNVTDQAFFDSRGGQIGLWFQNAPQAVFDDFGGGNVSP
jgi:hypothetical protein